MTLGHKKVLTSEAAWEIATAALYKHPTKNFADRLAQGETLVLKLHGAMPVEGGFPSFATI